MTIGVTARPLRAGAAMVAAVALLLAGCNGGGEVEPSPTTESPSTAEPSTPPESPTETETPTPDPTETSALPELPEEATENTPEGAEAFIRYYFDVLNDLHMSPRLGVHDHLVDPGCTSCESTDNAIQRLVDGQSRLARELYVIDELIPIGGGVPGVQRFNAQWHGPGTEVVSQDGEVLEEIPEQEFEGIMAAMWEGGQWLFYDSATSG